ncbi:MAG: site-specific integrase [Clostridiales bacterium]|nr:site-specific integrase [Clostridiales bacterium]
MLAEWKDKLNSGTDELFSTYLTKWVDDIKSTVSNSTYNTYRQTVNNIIVPYFREKKIKLCDLKPYHIQDFYKYKMDVDGVTANTIHHYQANISRALKDAVRLEKIPKNPAASVQLPKKEKHTANCYTLEELQTLLKKTKGTDLETIILLAAWFGLRRGEIIGLKWECIDFNAKTLSVTGVMSDKGTSSSKTDNLHYAPSPKTQSSIRSFPLTEQMLKYFRDIKQAQDKNKTDTNYNHKWDEFVCVRSNGDIITLEYVTRTFPKVCVECGLRRLKLHELRHTNISLLLNDPNITMKELQEWAGHSTYNTTANIYSHLQTGTKSKLSAAISNMGL